MARFTGIRRPDPGAVSRRRRLLIGGLVLFLAVDVALVAVALNAPHPTEEASGGTASPTVRATPTPTATSKPKPTVAPVAAVLPTRLIVARDGELAWRAATGACPATSASPELTTNSGATWKPTDATGPTGVRSLQSITIEGREVASMIGQSAADCSTMFVRTYVAGDNYEEYPADLAGVWFVNPLNRAALHSPAGDFSAPCTTVLTLAARDANNAAVLCGDQTVFTTTDAAASWSPAMPVSGALNLAPSAAGYVVAAVGAPGCAGVEILSITEPVATPQFTPTGCFPSDVAPASFSGNVALSEAAGTLWLWAGDSLSRSGDGGATWQ